MIKSTKGGGRKEEEGRRKEKGKRRRKEEFWTRKEFEDLNARETIKTFWAKNWVEEGTNTTAKNNSHSPARKHPISISFHFPSISFQHHKYCN
jgi:hypothetical protein